MNRQLNCPECGHHQLHCNATIKAVLTTKQHDDGTWDYELLEWEHVETIECYDCLNCGFGFWGNEEEFLKSIETTKIAVN